MTLLNGLFATSSGGAVLTPVTRGLVVWYDFSDAANLVLSGSQIVNPLDKSGNGNHAIAQATASKRAIFTANQQGGRATAVFTGVSAQTYQCPSALLTVPGAAYTLFETVKRNTDSGTQLTMNMGIGSSSTRSALVFVGAGQMRMKAGADASTGATTSGLSTTTFNVFGGSYNGTTGVSLSVNGAAAVTGSDGSVQTTCDNVWLGSRNDTSFYLDGQWGDTLLYNVQLTPTEMAQNFAYEKAKYGTP